MPSAPRRSRLIGHSPLTKNGARTSSNPRSVSCHSEKLGVRSRISSSAVSRTARKKTRGNHINVVTPFLFPLRELRTNKSSSDELLHNGTRRFFGWLNRGVDDYRLLPINQSQEFTLHPQEKRRIGFVLMSRRTVFHPLPQRCFINGQENSAVWLPQVAYIELCFELFTHNDIVVREHR